MKTFVVFVIALNSLAWGQSMTSQKTVSNWNAPTVESSFNHCLTSNESQNCWFNIAATTKAAKTIIANAGKVVAVDTSCGGYVYNDGKTNSWTYHQEWGCVQAAEYDYDGNLYALRQYVSAGRGYYWSKWASTKWTNLSCCFQSARMVRGIMIAYDINGTLWKSTNYGATVASQAWCAPAGPSAIAPKAVDQNKNATFYVACTGGKLWYFDGTNWGQLPGSGTAISLGAPGTNPYIVASNGNVQRFNGVGWDDMITNTPVSSLSAGDPFNIWMVGPKSASGSSIWRTWENGLLVSHSYGGSVSCGQGVPEALCNTFTHNVNHQICYGGHCGPVAQSSWTGAGGWGPNATVFANPYDLWTCLLADEPAGPCGLAENEASMECSGGGSNQDNAPEANYIVGDSIDVKDFSGNVNDTGPMNVQTGPYGGYVLGQIENITTENCWPQDPVPVCPQPDGLTINNRVDWWGGPTQHAEALTLWNSLQNAGITGEDAPYVLHSFYWAILNPDGTVYLPSAICFGGWLGSQDYLWGNYEARPHCK